MDNKIKELSLQNEPINVLDGLLQIFLKAVYDEGLRKKYLSRDYQKVWDNNWGKICDEFQKDPPIKPLIPPDNNHSFFNCAINYCYAKGQNTIVFEYLGILASSYSNFHAARALVNICINQLFSEKENASINSGELILKGCQIASHAAVRHLTPGYILSAMMHFFAGQYISMKDKSMSINYYSICYQQLLMADALEPYCAINIETCYTGKGIISSNPWGCETIQELISHFSQLIDLSFLPTKRIQKDVEKELKSLLPLLETTPDESAGLSNFFIFK